MHDESRNYHHGDLPDALLSAVDELVREGGVGAVTLREAARRAAVSHAAPAHHFGDKAGLLTAYAVQGFAALHAELRAARERAVAEGEEPLLSIGLAYIRFAVAEPGRFSVMFRVEAVHSDQPVYRKACDSAFTVVLDAVRDLRAALGDDDADCLHAATGAWAIVHGFATLWLDGNLAEEITADGPDMAAAAALEAFGSTLLLAAGVQVDDGSPAST
jgi:AcrR family transcriptional regulator